MIRSAPPVIGQRRQRLDHVNRPAVTAIGAFQSPDSGDHFFINAIFGLNRAQGSAMLAQCLLAVFYPRVRGGAVQVFPQRLGEFRLISVFLDHVGIISHPSKGPVQRSVADPFGVGAFAKTLEPALKSHVLTGNLRRVPCNDDHCFGSVARAHLRPQRLLYRSRHRRLRQNPHARHRGQISANFHCSSPVLLLNLGAMVDCYCRIRKVSPANRRNLAIPCWDKKTLGRTRD